MSINQCTQRYQQKQYPSSATVAEPLPPITRIVTLPALTAQAAKRGRISYQAVAMMLPGLTDHERATWVELGYRSGPRNPGDPDQGLVPQFVGRAVGIDRSELDRIIRRLIDRGFIGLGSDNPTVRLRFRRRGRLLANAFRSSRAFATGGAA